MGRRVRSRGSMGSTVDHLSESGNAVPLAPGACYLIKEKKPDLSYRLFSMLTRDGTPGLIVTRQHPERVRQGRGNEGGRIVWLSHTPGEDHHNPTPSGAPATRISVFVEENQGVPVAPLDRIEYPATNKRHLQTTML